MSYSRNYLSYPPFFTSLVKSFEAGPDVIEFKFPSRTTCVRIRVQFYAFYRALENAVPSLRKSGDIEQAADIQSLAALARTRIVELNPDLLSDNWVLSFTRRDAQPDIISMQNQLSSQIASLESTPTDPFSLPDFTPDSDSPDSVNTDGLYATDDEEKS